MEKLDIRIKIQQKSERLLYAMVFILVFEGILRKLIPSLSTLIFISKDILCIIGLYYVNTALINNSGIKIFDRWKIALLLFIPPIFFTALLDPVLAIFGLKQYLLYIVVGVLMPIAFPSDNIKQFEKIVFFVTILLIPTTLVAILQNSLPATHWLNLSVDGGSLEGFSADGYLRVSSTFSFTGQYSFFLNLATPWLACIIFWPKQNIDMKRPWLLKIYYFVAVMSLMIGVFITGGRSAVLGSGLCLILGLVFSAIKAPGKIVIRGLIGFAFFITVFGVVRTVKPEYFAAYEARSSDQENGTQNQEMVNRIEGSFLGGTKWIFDQDIVAIIFGNGLGVLSNGSEKISRYAGSLKDNLGIDIESDFATTLFEGGLYLAVVWTSLRLWAIFYCLKVWYSIKQKEWAILTSFLLAHVTLTACLGVLGKQPPLNMWLWLSVGAVAVIKNYTEYLDNKELAVKAEEIAADTI